MVISKNDIINVFDHRRPGYEEGFKEFSVMMPIIEVDGILHILYEVRSNKIKRQPGEVCFPGGKMEEGEKPLDCALRETYEEIGIGRELVKFIRQADTIYSAGKFAMYCYVALLEDDAIDKIRLNEAEVAETFLIPLDELIQSEPMIYYNELIQNIDEDFPNELVGIDADYPWARSKSPVPIYQVGERIVWGLTARATRQLIKAISM